ncbi:MAG: ABC transporter ATP-binding protein [Tissierellia bacterium]|nr:ABC transporter ATP-binding protein [Tissierellia bacterium]
MIEAISTVDLTKTYGDLRAVDNLNLSIGRGEIFGFLGLNGAGKTTTIRMLLGMITPTSGYCYLNGERINKSNMDIWNDVGYIVETPYSYPELTVRENLEIVRRLRGIEDRDCVDWIIDKLKLGEYESRRVEHLSLGNAQRLGIAKAIIHRPKILLLDEPTNGLDPAGIVEVRRLLMDLAENEGVTVLISSHKLDEISKIATNIGIIHEGRLIKEIDGGGLQDQLRKSLVLDGRNKLAMRSILFQAGYDMSAKDGDLRKGSHPLRVHDEGAVNAPEKIATLLVKAGHPPTLLKVEEEDLEMYFLRMIEEYEGIRNE